MVGLAEWTDEKEILFPEMTALIIGLLIIDKRVWNVKRWQIILLMTLGAAVGICIVRYSPLPYVVNLCAAFAFAGASLLISRATLIPLISAWKNAEYVTGCLNLSTENPTRKISSDG